MKQEYCKPMCRIIGTEWSGALDGGGSSCMYVKGSGTFGYNTSRTVASTVGFFER